MKTLFVSYRVTDLDHSLAFYTALGYVEVGRVGPGDGTRLVMLRFPDEPAVSLELVHRPADGPVDVGTGVDHLAVQVDALTATLGRLADAGLSPGDIRYPGGADGPRTSWLTDPDGYRIELVEWPPGHPDGITDADFAPPGG
jgi:lactoylglutathione lyase